LKRAPAAVIVAQIVAALTPFQGSQRAKREAG